MRLKIKKSNLDVGELNAYWDGVASGLGGYDSNADISPASVPDGCVNLWDIGLVSANWTD